MIALVDKDQEKQAMESYETLKEDQEIEVTPFRSKNSIHRELSMAGEAIHVRILRYSPEDRTERVDRFNVPHRRGMTVQTMLQYIYENIDPSLAFRNFRCGRGICNACAIRVNGRVLRTCETLVHAGQEIHLEPANDRIIKDLVVQLD